MHGSDRCSSALCLFLKVIDHTIYKYKSTVDGWVEAISREQIWWNENRTDRGICKMSYISLTVFVQTAGIIIEFCSLSFSHNIVVWFQTSAISSYNGLVLARKENKENFSVLMTISFT